MKRSRPTFIDEASPWSRSRGPSCWDVPASMSPCSTPGSEPRSPACEYFADIVEEVRESAIPESYWEPLRTKVTRMEQQWLRAHAAKP